MIYPKEDRFGNIFNRTPDGHPGSRVSWDSCIIYSAYMFTIVGILIMSDYITILQLWLLSIYN